MENNFKILALLTIVYAGGFLCGMVSVIIFYKKYPNLHFINSSAELRAIALLNALNKARTNEQDV